MIRVVLDTNVLISGLFWSGVPRHIVDLAVSQQIIAFTSPDIIEELAVVLHDDFDVSSDRVKDIVRDVLSYSHVVRPRPLVVRGLRDPMDAKVISCAVCSNAGYIVTGDKDLLSLKRYAEARIISPREFLNILVQCQLSS